GGTVRVGREALQGRARRRAPPGAQVVAAAGVTRWTSMLPLTVRTCTVRSWEGSSAPAPMVRSETVLPATVLRSSHTPVPATTPIETFPETVFARTVPCRMAPIRVLPEALFTRTSPPA